MNFLALPPDKSLQQSVNHEVPGRGRMESAPWRPLNSAVRRAMRSTKWLGVVALFIAWCSPVHAQICLDGADKPGIFSHDVTVRPLPSTPSFYSRADDYVAFIPQQDVREFFERARRETKDESLRRLANMVLSDLPIKANQDLFAYVTRDWTFFGPVNFSIIQLISDGRATLTNLSGVQVDRLTVTREQNPRKRSTTVLLGAKASTRILWNYECNMG